MQNNLDYTIVYSLYHLTCNQKTGVVEKIKINKTIQISKEKLNQILKTHNFRKKDVTRAAKTDKFEKRKDVIV